MATSPSASLTEAELASRLKLYASIQELDVSFEQKKHLGEMNLVLPSSGRIHVLRPDQVTWEIQKPARLIVRIDKTGVEMKTFEGAQVKTQSFKAKDMGEKNSAKMMEQLVPWLLLDAQALSAQYVITAPQARHLLFEPRNQAESLFVKLEVTLNLAGHMERLVLHEKSKDSLEIQFGKPNIIRQNSKIGQVR